MKTIKLPLQKNYPKEIYFGQETYKIKFKKNLDCFGMTDSGDKIIYIKDGLPPREILSTFIHELFHLVEFEQPLKIQHKMIYELEKAVTHILLDNFL